MTYYSIVFNTSAGTRRTLRINNPTPGLSNSVIESALLQIIENDIFDSAKGSIEGLHSMELVSINRTVIA